MADWVIFSLPVALALYGIALFFCLFDRFYRATRGVFTWLSAVFAILGTVCALLNGAGLWEAAGLLLVFLLLDMGVRE